MYSAWVLHEFREDMNTIGEVRLGKAQVNESSNKLAINTRIRENRTSRRCQLVMLLTWS